MSSDGIAAFRIFVSKLLNGAWAPEGQLTPDAGTTVHAASASFDVPALAKGDTRLLTIPLLVTPIASGGSVTATATLFAGGTLEGRVATPAIQPGESQAGSTTLFIELVA
jgi:hypothetical protein